jgi:hypothetical protein
LGLTNRRTPAAAAAGARYEFMHLEEYDGRQ